MRNKILFIHHSGNLGGAPRSLSYILKSLDRKEYDPYLINISEGPSNDIFIDAGVEPIILKGARPFHGSTVAAKTLKLFLRNILFLIPTILVAYKNIKKIKPDIVHLNSTCLFAFAIATKIWSKNTPVVCHVREPLREGFWGWAIRFFSKNFVDGFIAISFFDLSSLNLEADSKKRTIVIPNFVDQTSKNIGDSGAELRSRLGIDIDDVVFLFLARFAKGNGVCELIEMAKSVIKDNNKYVFVLAGADPFFRITDINTDRIKILPFQKQTDELLAICDVFVCPFTEPHFSRGLIEAAAVGIPAIGNNIGGVNELIREGVTGFLYNDEKSFIKYVTLLGENSELRNNMGIEATKLAALEFNYYKNLDKTYGFIKSFLKNVN